LVIGHWSLVIGHWSLVVGHWLLVIGHWSLVISHWSLVINPATKESAFIDLLVTKLQLGNANREAPASHRLEGSWKLFVEGQRTNDKTKD
jgi:hypothetical protein